MPTYVIERTVPGAGQMDEPALATLASKSNEVLRDLGPDVQWLHSYVTDDKIICVYQGTGATSSVNTAAAAASPSTPSTRSVPPSTRQPPRWSHEPRRDQPDHWPRRR